VTFSMPPESYRTLQPERPAGRRVRVWDVALSVVLLVLLTLFTLGASYAGLVLGLASDACSPQTCDFALLNGGVWFALIAPWVVLLLAVALAVVQLVRHRIAFWVPPAAALLDVGLWFVGAAIVGAAVRS
jgi:sterol desaturase/sphingolipid hydroxylase (fatty acid hydroxylase superfamily)